MRHAPLNIVAGDILQIDWSHADIVLANCVTWGPELLNSVIEKAALLKTGTRFLAFARLPECAHMELRQSICVQMSWGSQPCFIYHLQTEH